jgi:hypothetical protein
LQLLHLFCISPGWARCGSSAFPAPAVEETVMFKNKTGALMGAGVEYERDFARQAIFQGTGQRQ